MAYSRKENEMQLIILLGMIAAGLVVIFWKPRTEHVCRFRQYEMMVLCLPTIEYEDLHVLDRIEAPIGVTNISVVAGDENEARERTLDQYHSTYPIKVLDDFSISVFVREVWPTDRKQEAIVRYLASVELEEVYHDARETIR